MTTIAFNPATTANAFMSTITTTTGTVAVYATPSTAFDELTAALAAGTSASFRPLHADGDTFVGRNPGVLVTVDPTSVLGVS